MSHDDLPDSIHMSFGDHLDELRMRLWRAVIGVIIALVVCFSFGEGILNFLKAPVENALKAAGSTETQLLMINVTDPFMIYMKVAFYAALFISSPWIAWQLWQFVAAGLYPHERRYVQTFAPFTALLFLTGAAFSYYVIVRYGLIFLIKFGIHLGVKPMLSMEKNLMLVLTLSLVMGLVFQLPIVMLILTKIGIVESSTFTRKRRHFVLGAIILAAVITPTGDPFNLALATLPILVLYEFGILLARASEKRRAKDLAG